jgi:glyoxylase-like metal-dependent hydrolase (beta-lactamase superfamily II)
MTRRERVTIDVDVRPRFTACYLRVTGGECAFIEAHTAHALPRLMAALADAGLRPEDVRWVVVTHAHLDHAAGAAALLAACPRAMLVAHPRTTKHLVDPEKLVASAVAVYGEQRFRELYGTVGAVPSERVLALGDGESFELGGDTLKVWHTSGHAYHHFVVDDPAAQTVYTGDTFGLVYPDLQAWGRFAIPSTSPTGFNAAEARRSIDKVLSLGERYVCPTHFGAYEDAEAIAAQLRRFIDRAERWVEQAARSGQTAAAAEPGLRASWRLAVSEEAPRFGKAEQAFLEFDVELNAQGLAYVATQARAPA